MQIQLLESFRPVSLLEAGACFVNLLCGPPITTKNSRNITTSGTWSGELCVLAFNYPILSQGRADTPRAHPQVSQKSISLNVTLETSTLLFLLRPLTGT